MHTVPVEVLDLLDFEDILTLRAPLLDSKFQSKYDELSRNAIALARDGAPPLVESIEQLERIRTSLSDTFTEIFDKELPFFIRRKKLGGGRELASNGVSIGLGLLGFIPGIGNIASAISLAKDSKAIVFNLANLRATPRALLRLLAQREAAMRSLASRRPSEKTLMHDAVDLLFSAMRERITLV